jgi:hypothetical protein
MPCLIKRCLQLNKRRLIVLAFVCCGLEKIAENQEIHATLDRYWEASVVLDLDQVHDSYHSDDIYFHHLIVECVLGP